MKSWISPDIPAKAVHNQFNFDFVADDDAEILTGDAILFAFLLKKEIKFETNLWKRSRGKIGVFVFQLPVKGKAALVAIVTKWWGNLEDTAQGGWGRHVGVLSLSLIILNK